MPDATSIRELARLCGRSDAAVRKWLARRDFPVQRQAPWSADDIADVRAWMQTLNANQRGRTSRKPLPEDQSKDYWLMRKYRAQALEQEGHLLDAETVKRAWVNTMAEIRQRVLMVAASVRTLCDHKPGDEVEKIVNEQLRIALDDVADRLGNMATSAGDDEPWGEGDQDATASESE